MKLYCPKCCVNYPSDEGCLCEPALGQVSSVEKWNEAIGVKPAQPAPEYCEKHPDVFTGEGLNCSECAKERFFPEGPHAAPECEMCGETKCDCSERFETLDQAAKRLAQSAPERPLPEYVQHNGKTYAKMPAPECCCGADCEASTNGKCTRCGLPCEPAQPAPEYSEGVRLSNGKHAPNAQPAPSAPREWTLRSHYSTDRDAMKWTVTRESELTGGLRNSETVHVVERSALTAAEERRTHFELLARRQVTELAAVESERDEAVMHAAIHNQAMHEAQREVEQLKASLKNEHDHFCKRMQQMQGERDAAQAEVERLGKRIADTSDRVVKARKERDALKEKCERLEQANAFQITVEQALVRDRNEREQLLIAERDAWRTQAEALAGALESAKGQLEHAGYTKNAAPAAGKALAAFEAFRKERG